MKTRLLLFLVSACATSPSLAADSPPENVPDVRIEKSIMIAMRDGVRLATDVYIPKSTAQKLPAILWRSVYNKDDVPKYESLFPELLQRGYAIVAQDTRGRADSEGTFVPSVGDRNDGYDTVSWIVDQPWSNRKVGTAGCSSPGEVQLLLAATRHPNHITSIPQSSASGYNVRGRPWASFDGGVFELAQTAGWFAVDPGRVDYSTLPIIDILKNAKLTGTEYENFASSNPEGPYYRRLEWLQPGDRLDVPLFLWDSWYDYGPAETLKLFNVLRLESPSARARENQFVIIAPGTHCSYGTATEHTVVGARDLGDARIAMVDLQLRWFDYWMKGIDNGITNMPKIQYYLMGRNQWKSADSWPIPGTKFRKMYLHSGGKANTRGGDGTLTFEPPTTDTSDSFTYDPADPVPSLGGHACCTGTDTGAGAYDQSKIEMRGDVLVYTSAPLDEGIEVTGPLELILYVSSSAKDTDFTGKLVDVYPDGQAFNIEEGALRMRYREGFDNKLPMRPGETYRARLSLHVTSNYFGPGHRIRLEVSSSNFPRWDRNLNTGGNNYDESVGVIATNRVHHSADRPSYIVLPVVE